jgi:hypothetical protein
MASARGLPTDEKRQRIFLMEYLTSVGTFHQLAKGRAIPITEMRPCQASFMVIFKRLLAPQMLAFMISWQS